MDISRFADRFEPFSEDDGQLAVELLREVRDGPDCEDRPGVREFFGKLVELAERHLPSRQRWRFVMIDPDRFDEVVDFLATPGSVPRPMVALRLWAKLFRRLSEPGEVLASRAELAAELGVSPDEVSRIVSALVKVGAMSADREGRGGSARYFVSPLIGTHLKGRVRDEAQKRWKLPLAAPSSPVELRRRALTRVAVEL